MSEFNEVVKEVHMRYYRAGKVGHEKAEAQEIMHITGCRYNEAMDAINEIMHPKDFKWSEKKPKREVVEEYSSYDPQEAMRQKAEQKYLKSLVHCPHCHSTSISYEREKVSLKRAIIGGWLFGETGAILGGLSSKKQFAVCLKCGRKWEI